jgi:hypothetical protein
MESNKEEKIAQFSGETRKESIINHFSLDLEEEVYFFKYIEALGYDENSSDELLTSLHEMFIKIMYEND